MASKYDDEESGGGKFADAGEGKGGGGGGGGGKGADAGDEGENDGEMRVLPPIVQAFAHHVMSKKFRAAVDKFLDANCREFAGVDLAEEQQLEWTEVFNRFVQVIEVQLEDFCKKHGVRSEDVFYEVQDVMRTRDLEDEFLPTVLRVAEYPYFLQQVTLKADYQRFMRTAEDMAGGEGGGGGKSDADDTLSGVWQVDKQLTNFDRLDRYLRAVRVPVVFRGLATGSFYSNKKVVLLHRPEEITIISQSPFGMQKTTYELDGRVHQVPNAWGADTPVTAHFDHRDAAVTVSQQRPANLPRGSVVNHTWAMDPSGGGRRLTCTMDVDVPGSARVVFEMVYKRVAAA